MRVTEIFTAGYGGGHDCDDHWYYKHWDHCDHEYKHRDHCDWHHKCREYCD
jgi:hypothetical protein